MMNSTKILMINCFSCCNYVYILCEKVDQGGLSLQRDQFINKSIEGDKVCPANGIFHFFAGSLQ